MIEELISKMSEPRFCELSTMSSIIQKLSNTTNLTQVARIVSNAARHMCEADAATFIVKQGDQCVYADEDAPATLWKGREFPMAECISGWVMKHRVPSMIKHMDGDARVPARENNDMELTSMVMVPIGTKRVVGAIGVYWSEEHVVSDMQLETLKSLGDLTAMAMKNVHLTADLKEKQAEHIRVLNQASTRNDYLEDFLHIVSHNVRAPLANVLLLGELVDESETLEEKEIILDKLKPLIGSMRETLDQLLDVAQIRLHGQLEQAQLAIEHCLNKAVCSLQVDLMESDARVTSDFSEVDSVTYPQKYLDSILLNLLSNAVKYRSPERQPHIHVRTHRVDGWILLEVKDNGRGLDLEKYRDHVFQLGRTFHRHPQAKGFGLFITKSQVEAMGGKITVDSKPDQGASFRVWLAPERANA